MKNLGVTKVIRKSKTRIERTLSEGMFSVERDESVLIPLPIFIAAWKQLKSAVSKELFGEENDFEIEELTSVEFRIAQIEDDPNDVQLSSIICKGRLFLGRHTDFANAHFYGEDSLKIATQLYVAAADYFDGKNAQMEFSEIEKD